MIALTWNGLSSAAILRVDYKGQGQGKDTNKKMSGKEEVEGALVRTTVQNSGGKKQLYVL